MSIELKISKLKSNYFIQVLVRYLFIFFINFFLFSKFFSNSMSYLFTQISYWSLSIFYNIDLFKQSIFYKYNEILIVESCISIPTYIFFTLFFFALNEKRVFKAWLLSCSIFSVLNLFRMIFLILILIHFGNEIFINIHFIFYQALTSFFTIIIYMLIYIKYKFKTIPVYSDMINILKMKN